MFDKYGALVFIFAIICVTIMSAIDSLTNSTEERIIHSCSHNFKDDQLRMNCINTLLKKNLNE